jgi:FkbM family methyltransferase
MLYNVNDVYIGRCLDLYGEWSWPEIEATIQYADGGGVLDIGANIGTHTLAYSKHSKWVIAYEPVTSVFTNLCANLALNCIENVYPMHAAVGTKHGITSIPVPILDVENNLGCFSAGSGDQQVPMMPIDAFNLDDIALIKIDVEGNEEEVLRGAIETIQRCKPVLYVENDRKEKSDSLCSFIDGLGYTMSEHAVPLYREDNYRGNTKNVFPGIYSLNMLCIPKR